MTCLPSARQTAFGGCGWSEVGSTSAPADAGALQVAPVGPPAHGDRCSALRRARAVRRLRGDPVAVECVGPAEVGIREGAARLLVELSAAATRIAGLFASSSHFVS